MAGEASVVALVALLCTAWVMRLWRADLAAPFHYVQLDDTKFYLMLVRSIIRHGWYTPAAGLGAPFGQVLHDFPQAADNLNFLIIRVLAIFSSNPALVLNLFILLGFPLNAVSAFLVARSLGLPRGPAGVCGVLFALLPYHFYRAQSQPMLAAYYSVPIACYLFLAPLAGRPLFARGRRQFRSWISARNCTSVALCAVVASAGLYYAAFALVLLAAGAIGASVARRRRSLVASSAIALLLIAGALFLNLAPSIVYRGERGTNRALIREVGDSEALGLSISQLLLPVQDHRLSGLRPLNGEFGRDTSNGLCEQCYETLGTVGDAGFIWLVGGGLLLVLGFAGSVGAWLLFRPVAFGVLVSLLVAAMGGFSALIAFFVTPDIRGWNRMSLFIAFFSLLAAAALLQRLARRIAGRWRGRYPAALVLAVVVILGVLDETSNDFIPSYAAAAREYRADKGFFARVEAALPRGASVFELPYVPFPEGWGTRAVNNALGSPNFGTSYEEARGYISSSSLRWSYGAMKGRPEDWMGALSQEPIGLTVRAAAASGFQALLVMPGGFPVAPARLLGALQAELGERPLISPSGEEWMFDLRPLTARLRATVGSSALAAARGAALHPLSARCTRTGAIIVNPASSTRRARLSIAWAGWRAGVVLRVRFPGSEARRVRVGGGSVISERWLDVPPGSSAIVTEMRAPATFAGGGSAALSVTDAALLRLGSPGDRKLLSSGYATPPCQLSPRR